MPNFDLTEAKKFLAADEQTQREMVCEVICPVRYGCDACSACPDKYCHEDFRILAFELRDKATRHYDYWLEQICSLRKEQRDYATPEEIICAALMAWPERKDK